jgi:hypothetical protein
MFEIGDLVRLSDHGPWRECYDIGIVTKINVSSVISDSLNVLVYWFKINITYFEEIKDLKKIS